jgi:PKD repeat protein
MLSYLVCKIKNINFQLLIILLLTNTIVFGQCEITSITVTDEVCREELVIITNGEAGAGSFFWDFCPGDFEEAPSGSQLIATPLVDKSFTYEVVNDNGLWYGFTVGNISKKLVRFDFGSSLDNVPALADLGSQALFSGAQDIKFVKVSGSWYALIVNTSTSQLLLADFGTNIESIANISVVNISGLDAPHYIDIELIDGDYYAFVTNDGNTTLTRINFGNTLSNEPQSIDHIAVTGGNDIRGVDIVRECDNWFGLVVSQFNKRVYKLSFGTDIDSSPTLANLVISFGATDISVFNEGGNFYGVCQAISGQLIKVDYGSTLSNAGDVTNWGALGLSTNVRGFALVSDLSNWYAYSIDQVGRALQKYVFVNSCDVNDAVSTEKVPQNLKFDTQGKHYISVEFISESGTRYNYLDSVQVLNDIAPEISFVNNNVVCLTTPTMFTSESSSGGLSYTWDFGDGSPTSVDANPTHTFSAAGEYEVILSVEDGTCSNFTKQTITIYDEPIPDFNVPVGNICTNQPYVFENTTPGDFGELITYSWELDGDAISSEQDLEITFNSGGTKELKLIASIPGCDVEIAKNLTNVKEGTLPVFSFNDSCVGEEVLFTNSTFGDITDVSWEFSNGFNSTLSNPTMVFDTEGTFDATLYITNADGCETFDTQTITIHALPVIDFSNELACEELATQFEDLSTVNIDNLASWRWDFGDGSDFSEAQNATHIFDDNGDYEVELTATSSFGCVDSLTKVVSVLDAPVVAFDYDKICLDVPIQFTDASTAVEGEAITDWSWNLGGTFTAEQNPQTTFSNTLDYSVSLTVTSSNLCTATQTQVISIPEVPTLDFSLVNDCENETAQITDVTQISGDVISQYNWSINGDQVANNPDFEYDFSSAGSYNIDYAVVTENGCEFEISRSITIHPTPIASFATSFDFGAPPFVVDFTNQSAGAQSYSWEFEEGAMSTAENPSHTFESLGEFDISLVAISDQNCSDTTSRRIQVLEPLLDAEILNFNVLPTATGDKLSFAIRNNGTIRLDSLYVTVNLGGELEVYETINKAMNPNEVVSAQLALTIDNKRLDYICIYVRPFIQNYQDANEDNNRGCITFGQETFIVSNPYPNPSTSTFALDVIATKDAVAEIELLSTAGDLLNTFNAQVYEGNNKLDFDLHRLKSGLYFLKVKLDGQNKVHRLVINN